MGYMALGAFSKYSVQGKKFLLVIFNIKLYSN